MKTQEVTAVDLARDVIKWIDAKRIVACPGTYLGGEELDDIEYDIEFNAGKTLVGGEEVTGDTSLKDIFPKIKCDVCAIGGLLYSYIDRFNQVNLDEIVGSDSMAIKKLSSYFSEGQLRLMETAFEGEIIDSGYFREHEYNTYVISNLGKHFYSNYADSDQRLKAIMRNVIRNNGKFIFPRWVHRKIGEGSFYPLIID